MSRINNNFSYNEFHVSRVVRELCGIKESLFASYGNVILKNIRGIRLFTEKLNNLFDERGQSERRVSAGSLNAMGLLDEIFHIVSMLYRRDFSRHSFSRALEVLDEKFGKNKVDDLLLEFINEFPSTAVYQKKISAESFLQQSALDAGTGEKRTNREAVLEEMMLLHLANENPAFKPFGILFDDTEIASKSIYKESWKEIQHFFAAQPAFGPFSHDLIATLREPVVFSPDDLRGQLEYVQKHWVSSFPELRNAVSQLFASLDLLSEEAKAAWHPVNGGGRLPEMAPYNYENLMKEYERFSPDKDWMPNVVLMAKTILVWLDQLSKKYKRSITRLDQIPDEELDILAQEGFTGLWLIGLWERSSASRRIKQLCGNPEAAASAYSLYDYDIAQNIGGWDAAACGSAEYALRPTWCRTIPVWIQNGLWKNLIYLSSGVTIRSRSIRITVKIFLRIPVFQSFWKIIITASLTAQSFLNGLIIRPVIRAIFITETTAPECRGMIQRKLIF